MSRHERLFALALLALVSCSDDCHDIGCGPALIVELAPASETFGDGSYDVELSARGRNEGNESCHFVIAGGTATDLDCSPGVATLDSSELPRYVLVRYPGDYFADTLSVALSRDGALVVMQDFTPEYQDVSVDEQACGGSCTAAQVSLAF